MNLQSRTPATVRHHLQASTAEQHRALDRAFVLLDLQKANDYRRFLMAQAAVVAPLEGWLTRQSIAGILPDWPDRQRADALAEDLAGLGGRPVFDSFTIDTTSPAALLGVTYVLEGSRLGAQYLSRIVSASIEPAVRNNMRFLEHGTGLRLWPSFLQTLEAMVGEDPRAIADATTGAQKTFDIFLTAQRRHAPTLVSSA